MVTDPPCGFLPRNHLFFLRASAPLRYRDDAPLRDREAAHPAHAGGQRSGASTVPATNVTKFKNSLEWVRAGCLRREPSQHAIMRLAAARWHDTVPSLPEVAMPGIVMNILNSNTPLYALTAAAVLASTKLATHDHLAANGLRVVDGKVEIIPPPDEDEDDAPTEFELRKTGKVWRRLHRCCNARVQALEENESKE